MSYTITNFERTHLILKLSNGEIVKINSLDYRKYCPPLLAPKSQVTNYTIIENSDPRDEQGFRLGDIISVPMQKPSLDLFRVVSIDTPRYNFTENNDGATIKYRQTTQCELDRFESIYYPHTDNAKVYKFLMSKIVGD